jgi:hypothetical protein
MNTKRYLASVVAVFVFVALFDHLYHGFLMHDIYEQTASLWRTEAEMMGKMSYMLLSQLAFSAVIAFIFTRNYQSKGIGEGLRFGLYIGLLIASLQIGVYTFMPVPCALVLGWMAAELLKGIGAGILLSLTYKR